MMQGMRRHDNTSQYQIQIHAMHAHTIPMYEYASHVRYSQGAIQDMRTYAMT